MHHVCITEKCPDEFCPIKVSSDIVRFPEIGSREVCFGEVCPSEVCFGEVCSPEVGVGEVDPAKVGLDFSMFLSPLIPRRCPFHEEKEMAVICHLGNLQFISVNAA